MRLFFPSCATLCPLSCIVLFEKWRWWWWWWWCGGGGGKAGEMATTKNRQPATFAALLKCRLTKIFTYLWLMFRQEGPCVLCGTVAPEEKKQKIPLIFISLFFSMDSRSRPTFKHSRKAAG